MSKFIKNKINSDIITIIDLWSYKIRVAICEFLKNNSNKESIKLLAFTEKRQSIWDIETNTIKNLDNICENIQIAIKKAEKIAKIKTNKVAINSSFMASFLENSILNYKRKNKNNIINIDELKNILKDIETKSIKNQVKRIQDKYDYSYKNLDIILNDISNINIDNELTSKLVWFSWEKISFNITNIFMPKSNFDTINYIERYLKIKITKILPEEFSLTRLWKKQKDIVIINIWNSSSYITIKDKNWNIVWSIKIDVWIEKLINNIKINSQLTRSEIIKKLNRDDFYKQEKKDFLDIYSFLILQSLKEIVKEKICPNNFFIIWWWWNNNFFKNYLKKINFMDYWIKITKQIKFILPDIKKIAKIDNVEDILNKSNLNIISMILTYDFLLQKKENTIEKITKTIIEKLED